MPESAHSYPQFRPSGEASRNYFIMRPWDRVTNRNGCAQMRCTDRSKSANNSLASSSRDSSMTWRPSVADQLLPSHASARRDVRGCPELHRNRRSGPRPRSHANRYHSTASALACMPEASHSPTRMPRRHIRVSQRRFEFEPRWEVTRENLKRGVRPYTAAVLGSSPPTVIAPELGACSERDRVRGGGDPRRAWTGTNLDIAR